MRFKKTSTTLGAALAFVLLTAADCAPAGGNTTSDGKKTNSNSCSPDYTGNNKHGRITASQSNPGGSVRWGFYPADPLKYKWFTATVSLNNVQVDVKNQPYAPHATVSSTDVRRVQNNANNISKKGKKKMDDKLGSGARVTVVFRVTGVATSVKGKTLRFKINCNTI